MSNDLHIIYISCTSSTCFGVKGLLLPFYFSLTSQTEQVTNLQKVEYIYKDGAVVVTRTECYKRHMPHVTTVTRRELQMLQRACYNCYTNTNNKTLQTRQNKTPNTQFLMPLAHFVDNPHQTHKAATITPNRPHRISKRTNTKLTSTHKAGNK